jgi:hypothetical protein
MENIKAATPPSEEQITRVLNLFKRVADPFQRGKVLGKLEAYVEQSEARPIAQTEKSA